MPKNPFSRTNTEKPSKNESSPDQAAASNSDEIIELSEKEQAYLDKMERRTKENLAGNRPSSASAGTSAPVAGSKPFDRKSYQHDPRYKAFYKRLRQESDEEISNYEVEPEATTLEELERQGWDGTIKTPAAAKTPPAARPSVSPPPLATAPNPPQRPQAPQVLRTETSNGANSSALQSGDLLRLDDDSIGIYKDAVSGKDYALLYFLEPNGILAPRGIFLEQYETQRIGKIPENIFEQMRMTGRWDRDAVIFHLEKFEFAPFVRRVENRTPADQVRRSSTGNSRPAITSGRQPTPVPVERDPLERGRVIRINVAGKVWESVYWTKDEIGAIVAHDTNREWSLMHLDLSRFKDSIEYGELLDPEKLSEIEQSLSRAH
jgi:hypothetical protein